MFCFERNEAKNSSINKLHTFCKSFRENFPFFVKLFFAKNFVFLLNMRKLCEKIRKRNYKLLYNKTSNAKLSEFHKSFSAFFAKKCEISVISKIRTKTLAFFTKVFLTLTRIPVDSHLNYCRFNYGTFELLLVWTIVHLNYWHDVISCSLNQHISCSFKLFFYPNSVFKFFFIIPIKLVHDN